jgi:hypothetical protein
MAVATRVPYSESSYYANIPTITTTSSTSVPPPLSSSAVAASPAGVATSYYTSQSPYGAAPTAGAGGYPAPVGVAATDSPSHKEKKEKKDKTEKKEKKDKADKADKKDKKEKEKELVY